MARQRRGGGFRPPELPLRGTLGTLLRTAAAQVGPLREALGDALERTAREGRNRLDDALAGRRSARPTGSRTEALAELGEVVLELIRNGEIDLGELPEVQDIVAHLDALDHEEQHDEPVARAPSRNRFDARSRDARRGDDDGTVSSKTWSSAPRSAKPAPRVWRPNVDDAHEGPTDEITARERPARPSTERRVPLPKQPPRKGGISFDDDEDDDLADYMHPDDVPPKGDSDE